ncbi:MAG: hypothetical protein GY737_24650 [Desulfobacteraceae bacterium]|nr:hypothetical protein [Desulfobacteraceae bacterium]
MDLKKKISCLLVLLTLLPCLPLTVFAKENAAGIKTKNQVMAEGGIGVPQMSVGELKNRMDSNKKYVLVDVRTERERNAGYISGSVWLPRGVLEFKIQSVCREAETPLIVYCRKGGRSVLSVKTLQEMGYLNVSNLDGGINAWGEKGYSLFNWHGEIKVVAFDKKDPDLSTYDIFKK